MSRLWPKGPGSPAARGTGRPRRRRLKALAVITATAAIAAIGLGGSVMPAHADDDGNTFCYLSTGTLSATVTGTSSPHPIEVQWDVSAPYCNDYVVYINGPDFAPNTNITGLGGLSFTYLQSGVRGTWTLTLVDLANDYPYELATASVTGP